MKIVADNKIPFLKGALEPVAEVVYLPGGAITAADVCDADALVVRTRTICNRDLLEGSRVKCIASATIGFDHIDTTYCGKNQIFWTNAPGCNATSVVQYMASAMAHILEKTGKRFPELTLGIIGAGHVGSRVQHLFSSLGMGTLVNDPPRARREGQQAFVGLEELLHRSDIVSMHVPLNKQGADKTAHMADGGFLKMMKDGVWFINTSRGEVAMTGALLQALGRKKIAGAIIDVWEHEPVVSSELLNLADIATPHIAGYSADGKANGTSMSVRAVSRYFQLGLDNWTPASIPPPRHPTIKINGKNKTAEMIFTDLAWHTYDILADSEKLKVSPATFEKQRGDYPVRREPPAYRLELVSPDPAHIHIAKALGFESLKQFAD